MQHFGKMPPMCTDVANLGFPETRPTYIDWTKHQTTPDQLRIEEVIAKFIRKESKIIHVGMGNSKLAIRFSPLVTKIVGMSISQSEVEFAQGLGIANYEAMLWNKYRQWQDPANKFDVIVDNNPSTYVCCFHHLMTMFKWYAEALTEDGVILTDAEGLAHTIQRNPNERFSLGYSAWREIGASVGLQAIDLNGSVYALTRRPDSERIRAVSEGNTASRFLKRATGLGRRKTKKVLARLKAGR